MNTEDQNGSMNGHQNGHEDGTYITKVIPLPATALDLVYKTKKRLSLADHLETIHRKMFDDPKYRAFINAPAGAKRSEYVTGSEYGDDFSAARAMIDYAEANEIPLAIDDRPAKEHDVILKMRVAWRRFKHVARTDRFVLEFVPTAATAAPPPAE